MRRVRDGEALEAVAQDVGVSRHVMGMWMRGRNRTYLMERLASEGIPSVWQYNGGRRVPRQVPDEIAIAAMRRVINGEKPSRVAQELDVKYIVLRDWLSGKNRPNLLARLAQETLSQEE